MSEVFEDKMNQEITRTAIGRTVGFFCQLIGIFYFYNRILFYIFSYYCNHINDSFIWWFIIFFRWSCFIHNFCNSFYSYNWINNRISMGKLQAIDIIGSRNFINWNNNDLSLCMKFIIDFKNFKNFLRFIYF